jgi:hypothetical protein
MADELDRRRFVDAGAKFISKLMGDTSHQAQDSVICTLQLYDQDGIMNVVDKVGVDNLVGHIGVENIQCVAIDKGVPQLFELAKSHQSSTSSTSSGEDCSVIDYTSTVTNVEDDEKVKMVVGDDKE